MEKWLPEKVRALKAEGKLGEETHGAARLAQAEIDHLMRHCHYQEHEAREVASAKFILLRPKPEADDWEREELAELPSCVRWASSTITMMFGRSFNLPPASPNL